MPSPSDTAATVVAELHAAAEIVARRMSDCRYKTQILRHIGVAIMSLERADEIPEQAMKLCRRCGKSFLFDEKHFVSRGFTPPRHCGQCRVARRRERERAGALLVPPAQGSMS